jgi:hypothetical protein
VHHGPDDRSASKYQHQFDLLCLQQKKEQMGDQPGVYQKKIAKLLRRVNKEVHKFQQRNRQKKDERLFR